MVSENVAGQEAPGSLEAVRTLLNSWLIPNDTRKPTDRFDRLADEISMPNPERDTTHRLRDDLRRVVEDPSTADEVLTRWIRRVRVTPAVENGSLVFRHQGGYAGNLLTTVLSAIAAGQWQRLKACPDCHWVFYDHTRNGSKKWCLMNAGGPQGRACGTIAKVRRHRERRRQEIVSD